MAKNNTTKAFENITNIRMEVYNAVLPIREIIEGYVDNSETEEGGITSMNGKLNIRPKYQRAYVADTQPMWRENLINSIICGFPINRIYIGIASGMIGEDDVELEMLDGQQRTKTICDYVKGDFAIKIDDMLYHFDNLDEEIRERILNYNLDVTYCKGTESARIAWFKRINQPNSILTAQELRNATYLGTWLESAKKFFCGTTAHTRKPINNKEYKYCLAKYTMDKYIERAEYLETAIDWLALEVYADLRGKKDADKRICKYMAEHQHDENADELIAHYKKVIDWITATFRSYQKCMTKVEWGRLYAEYGSNEYDLDELNEKVNNLMLDSEVTANSAVFEYVLMGCPADKENMLVLRAFQEREKEVQYKLQNGIDPISRKPLDKKTMKAHHITPWSIGGKTELDNLILINSNTHHCIHDEGLYNPTEVRRMRDEWIAECSNK